MPLQVEMRDLEMVEALAGEGTVSAAAGRLALSQPALSRRLAGLEHRLGAALFLRTGRRLQLTAAGDRLLAAARQVLPELARAEAELAGDQVPAPAAPLRVVATLGAAFTWLPDAWARHAAQMRQTAFLLDPVPDAGALATVAGRKDVLVVGPSLAKVPCVHRVTLFRDEICAFLSPLHPAAKGPFLPVESLPTLDLLQGEPDGNLPAFTQALRAHAVTPRRLTRLESLEGALELAARGYGVLCASRKAVEAAARSDRVRRVRLSARGLAQAWEVGFTASGGPELRSRAQELAAHCAP